MSSIDSIVFQKTICVSAISKINRQKISFKSSQNEDVFCCTAINEEELKRKFFKTKKFDLIQYQNLSSMLKTDKKFNLQALQETLNLASGKKIKSYSVLKNILKQCQYNEEIDLNALRAVSKNIDNEKIKTPYDFTPILIVCKDEEGNFNAESLLSLDKVINDDKVQNLSAIINSIEGIKAKKLRNFFEFTKDEKILPIVEKVIKSPDIKPSSYEEIGNSLANIGQKLDMIDDETIKDFVYLKLDEITQSGEMNLLKEKKTLDMCEDLLDVSNVLNNRYSNLNYVDEYYKYSKKQYDPKQAEELLSNANFNADARTEALKKFIYANNESQRKITDYLYDKYYLSTLEGETKRICKKIADEFGAKLFLINKNNAKPAKIIHNELAEWKKAGEEQVKFPSGIDLSLIKQNYIKRNKAASAFFVRTDKSIHIKGERTSIILKAFGHEMIHLNDLEAKNTDSIINGVDVSRMLRFKTYKNELLSAGLSYDDIEYAHKNKREYIAMAFEGDFTKYSEEFKKVLVKLGLPEWAFKLKSKKVVQVVASII